MPFVSETKSRFWEYIQPSIDAVAFDVVAIQQIGSNSIEHATTRSVEPVEVAQLIMAKIVGTAKHRYGAMTFMST